MSQKLFVVVTAVVVLLAIQTQAQSPENAPAGPSFEDVVADRHAKTLAVVNLLVAKSTAPVELREAVLLRANVELEECAKLAEAPATQKLYFACTGQVIKNASDTLNAAASSGATSSVN